MEKCPIFKEEGIAVITTPFGTNIPDYPTEGKTGNHYGLDLVRNVGYNTTATILALASGTVTEVRKDVKGIDRTKHTAGNYVKIEHAGGHASRYLHLKHGSIPDRIVVGAKVEKGEVIGYMGNTGDSYGAHLHFEVWKNGSRVNPEPYLASSRIDEPTQESTKEVTYTVERGDTLSGIGAKFDTPWREIAEANGIAGPKYTIYVGQRLTIPNAKVTTATHKVVAGDTLSAIAKKYGSSVDAIVTANRSKYPRINKNYIVVGWTLTVPREAK